MTDPSASTEDLMLFRFQIFYEDTIGPLDYERPGTGTDTGTPLDIFEIGELREASAVAALAVAAGVFPHGPFNTMLESPGIKRRLSGNLNLTVMLGPSTPATIMEPPPPITALPDMEGIQRWSEINLDKNLVPRIPPLINEYSSLIRQVRRNEMQRPFNSELLFATSDGWQAELEILAASGRNWFPPWGNVEYSIGAADGLDSYLDLADDLGAAVTDASGHTAIFNIDQVGTVDMHDAERMIRSDSLLPLMAWRFGGTDLADAVRQRVRSLEDVIEGLVAEVDVERLQAGRYEPRE